MNWDIVFGVANAAALIAWLLLILAPRRDIVVPILQLAMVWALCLLYALLITIGLTGGFGEAGDVDFTTIAGIRSIFSTDGGVTTGWTHYLAFDLFVGTWIALDADQRRISRLVQAPILLLTFVAGPVGLLIHLTLANLKGTARVDG